MRTNTIRFLAALVLPVLACMTLSACHRAAPAETATPAPVVTAAPTATPTPTPTHSPEPTPEETPVPAEDTDIPYELVGTDEEGEGYTFSAEVPRFGIEAVDDYFENRVAAIYNGFLAELETDGETQTFELTSEVSYHRDGIVSVVLEKYAYFGGAYPNVSYECATIDTEQKTRLLLGDVVSDLALLKTLAAENLPSEVTETAGEDLTRMLDESLDEENFSLGWDGIVLYFPDYVFGYRGWTLVTVPYGPLREAGVLADWVAD